MAIFQRSWLQRYPSHHIFAWPVINFTCQNYYLENSSLQCFAGKCNHLHVPVWMYKQLDWRCEPVLDKLEFTLTVLMCRVFFSSCGNLARCWDRLSASTKFIFKSSWLWDVLMGEPGTSFRAQFWWHLNWNTSSLIFPVHHPIHTKQHLIGPHWFNPP